MKILFAIAAAMPAVALAAGSFDGSWKMDTSSVKVSGKPVVFELKNGVYKCISCNPAPWSVKADGIDHKVSAHSYYDGVSARLVDEHTVELSNSLHGKTIFKDTMSVSDDGSTLTETGTDLSGAQPNPFKRVSKRVAAPASGAHAVSGSWMIDGLPELSDVGSVVSYRMTANGLQMSANGISYDAKFDGRKYPQKNDPGKTWVSLKRLSNDTIQETDMRDGQVTDVVTLSLSADGGMISVQDDDRYDGMTFKYNSVRQP
jgi:hypothetical protein